MTRSLAGLVALLAVLAVAASAVGEDAPPAAEPGASERLPPSLKTPLPFDHEEHEKVLRRVGLLCVDCHPIGLRADGPPKDTPQLPDTLPAPRAVCHGCHLAEVTGAPKGAGASCSNCHPVRAELLPEDHDLTWDREHAAEGRKVQARCDDCHDRGECVDCHEARGAMTRSPHPPGFGSFHGIEAKLDPNSCSSCHAADACTSCHSGGGIPW